MFYLKTLLYGRRAESGRHSPAPGSSRRSRLAALALVLASALLMSACSGVQVTERTAPTPPASSQRSSNVSNAPNTQETHDLAVAAVDFDPALDSRQIMMGMPYSLLVAVANEGNRQEGPITVTVQLLTQDRQQVLASSQRTLQMLAPGDVTVVRFPSNTRPPSYRAYILSAQVQSVQGETNTTNNKRTLEIQVGANN